MSPLMLVYLTPLAAALVPVGFGVAWLVSPDARPIVLARYPLRTVTWLIAGPAALACAAAVYFGVVFALEEGSWWTGTGTGEGTAGLAASDLAMPVLGAVGLGCAIAVLVFAHRCRPRHGMLAAAALPIVVVLWGTVRSMVAGFTPWDVALVLFLIGATANALLAASRSAPRSS